MNKDIKFKTVDDNIDYDKILDLQYFKYEYRGCRKSPKCCKCEIPMELDDVNKNFPDNYDTYYICYKCNIGAIGEIRFNKLKHVTYRDENADIIFEKYYSNLDGSEF